MANDLFGEPQGNLTEYQKEKLLKEIAWKLFPLDLYMDVPAISKEINVTGVNIKKYIQEFVKEGKLISFREQDSRKEYYRLPTERHLQLLLEIKADPQKYLERPLVNSKEWRDPKWVSSVRSYVLHGEKASLDIPDYLHTHEFFLFIQYMPLYKEWMPFFNQLPVNLLIASFYSFFFQYTMMLEKPNMTALNNGYLQNERIPSDILENFNAEHAFYQYVLSGRLEELMQHPLPEHPLYQCIKALYLQYQGKVSEAVHTYQQALKVLGTPVFSETFYDTYYILALWSENSPSSKKKMNALSKKKELNENPFLLPARLLLYHALDLNKQKMIEDIVGCREQLPPLVRVLSFLLIRHFHMDDNILISDLFVCDLINKDELKLLQLECSQDFMPFITKAEKLKEETGLSPLLPPYKKIEKWELIINKLMDKTSPGGTLGAAVTKEKTVSQSRIVYYVNRHAQITPRLQKSKDGITWSKGRNIALSTFQAGIPEMNNKDKIMATYVKCYHSSGWGYNETWNLQGPAAMAELAGYPLVFSESQPDVPVVITIEKPQITVTKTPKGFRIENNTQDTQFTNSVILQRENDFLFHVMELSFEQREILKILSEVKDFPAESEKQLAALLPQLSQILTVHSDLVQSEDQLKKVKADTLITVQLQPTGTGIKAELFVKPFIDNPPYCKAGKGNASVIGTIKNKKVQAIRDFEKERLHLQQVLEWLKPLNEDLAAEEDIFFFSDAYQCLDMLDILRMHINMVRIEWPQGVKMSIKGAVDFKDLSLSVKGAGQWFELEGELKIGTETYIKIAELLQKIRESKGRYIALSETEFISLNEKLRKELQALEPLLTENKGKLKLSSLTAGSLVEIEAQGAQLKKNTAFNDLIKRMEAAEKEHIIVPKQLKAELRNYQVDGFCWMSRLAYWGAGACLADDMGLGKTLQAITLMLSRGKQGASLVVAPVSVLFNWKTELERFAPSLTPLIMNETGCDRKALIETASDFDVVLTTYGLLINEADLLANKEWNVITLDEAHTIKNKETKMSKAAMELKGSFRLLLTGTPLQNHLGEIWNLFQFANPGLLGSFPQFTEKFISPIEKNGDKNRQRQLKRLLQPFILRRTKTEVLDELPEKTEITLHVELAEEERALYENLRIEAISNLEEGSTTAIQTLAEITKLRQAACHPSLVHPELNLPSAKSAAFLKLVEELMKNNHRSLVFSQFTSHLRLIRKELDEAHINYLYLDGGTSLTERTKLVKAFQTGDQPLFLISLKAGGLGVNLTAADFVIHLDPWWNPAIEDQASDRVYRIGQTRPVTVYRLIATQTIEEKIIRLHQTKKSLADSLLDGSDIAHKLTKEEMLELLKEKDF